MYGELISSVTVGAGGAASIDFTSIPQTYTDLVCVMSFRTATLGAADDLWISINGSTSSQTGRNLYGQGGSAGSWTPTTVWAGSNGYYSTSNTFASVSMYVPNYAGSTNKSFSIDSVMEDSSAFNASLQQIMAGLLSNTAAITSLSFSSTNAQNFVQYSTAYLYGLTKGSDGATVS